jgi:hypothetical protein
MAYGGNSKRLQIFGGEMAQVVGPDVILAECRLVALQTQVSQPTRDIHRRVSGSVTHEGEMYRLDGSDVSREQRIGRLIG